MREVVAPKGATAFRFLLALVLGRMIATVKDDLGSSEHDMEVANNLSKLDREPPKGRVYRYKGLLFWAQGGCICIEDTNQDGEFNVVTRAEFAARVMQFRAFMEEKTYRYADERNEDANFITNGCAAIKEGKRQGDPFDPRVMKDKMFEWRRGLIFLGNGQPVSRAGHDVPKSILMPTGSLMPPIPVKDAPNKESMRKPTPAAAKADKTLIVPG